MEGRGSRGWRATWRVGTVVRWSIGVLRIGDNEWRMAAETAGYCLTAPVSLSLVVILSAAKDPHRPGRGLYREDEDPSADASG